MDNKFFIFLIFIVCFGIGLLSEKLNNINDKLHDIHIEIKKQRS